MSKLFDLKWEGDAVLKLSEEQIIAIMGEIGLTAEAESKKELRKGHGVRTGTLRRSIHAEAPSYNFGDDNVEPSEDSPERGGSPAEATKIEDGRFAVALGSGLVYALSIHQGWGSFEGYHYLDNGVEKTRSKIGAIVGRHQVS